MHDFRFEHVASRRVRSGSQIIFYFLPNFFSIKFCESWFDSVYFKKYLCVTKWVQRDTAEGKKTAEMDDDATSEDNMDAQASPSSRLPADLAQLHSVLLNDLAQSMDSLLKKALGEALASLERVKLSLDSNCGNWASFDCIEVIVVVTGGGSW